MTDVVDVHSDGFVREYFFMYAHSMLDGLAVAYDRAVPEVRGMVDAQAGMFIDQLLEGVGGYDEFRQGFQDYYTQKKKEDGDTNGEQEG